MINEYSEQINKALLEMNFTSLTPIQTEVIPKDLRKSKKYAQYHRGLQFNQEIQIKKTRKRVKKPV